MCVLRHGRTRPPHRVISKRRTPLLCCVVLVFPRSLSSPPLPDFRPLARSAMPEKWMPRNPFGRLQRSAENLKNLPSDPSPTLETLRCPTTQFSPFRRSCLARWRDALRGLSDSKLHQKHLQPPTCDLICGAIAVVPARVPISVPPFLAVHPQLPNPTVDRQCLRPVCRAAQGASQWKLRRRTAAPLAWHRAEDTAVGLRWPNRHRLHDSQAALQSLPANTRRAVRSLPLQAISPAAQVVGVSFANPRRHRPSTPAVPLSLM